MNGVVPEEVLTVKLTVAPTRTDCEAGEVEITGASITVSVAAGLLVAEPELLLTITEYDSAHGSEMPVNVSVLLVEPETIPPLPTLTPLVRH